MGTPSLRPPPLCLSEAKGPRTGRSRSLNRGNRDEQPGRVPTDDVLLGAGEKEGGRERDHRAADEPLLGQVHVDARQEAVLRGGAVPQQLRAEVLRVQPDLAAEDWGEVGVGNVSRSQRRASFFPLNI